MKINRVDLISTNLNKSGLVFEAGLKPFSNSIKERSFSRDRSLSYLSNVHFDGQQNEYWKDLSKSFSTFELRAALAERGYRISTQLLGILVIRYASGDGSTICKSCDSPQNPVVWHCEWWCHIFSLSHSSWVSVSPCDHSHDIFDVIDFKGRVPSSKSLRKLKSNFALGLYTKIYC